VVDRVEWNDGHPVKKHISMVQSNISMVQSNSRMAQSNGRRNVSQNTYLFSEERSRTMDRGLVRAINGTLFIDRFAYG